MNKRIEKEATKVLVHSGQINEPPVDPVTVANFLGLSVVYENFSDGLSGVLVRKAGASPTIIISNSDSINRQRFSIAHECGHFVLNHSGELFVDNFVLNRRDVRSSYAIDSKEIEANAFAAALLMPQDLLLSKVVELMEGDVMPTQKSLIFTLAGLFEVSEQAMGYRLSNLGIVTAIGDESP